MKKVYNLIIAVLIVALIVVIAMIVIRYGGNYLNEKEVSASLETIEEELNKEETQQSESLPELEFKGYKVEGIIEIPKINFYIRNLWILNVLRKTMLTVFIREITLLSKRKLTAQIVLSDTILKQMKL